jgi:hypothetical protein
VQFGQSEAAGFRSNLGDPKPIKSRTQTGAAGKGTLVADIVHSVAVRAKIIRRKDLRQNDGYAWIVVSIVFRCGNLFRHLRLQRKVIE